MFGWVFSVRVFPFWPSSLCVINAVSHFVESLPILSLSVFYFHRGKEVLFSVSAELEGVSGTVGLSTPGAGTGTGLRPFSFLFASLAFTFCVWMFLPACMYVYIPSAYLVPMNVSRPWSPWNWSYRQLAAMWVLGTKPGSLVRAASAVDCWANPLAPLPLFFKFF